MIATAPLMRARHSRQRCARRCTGRGCGSAPISGTYVVFLAFDMKAADANGLMGFAIQRTRLSDGETIWLRGNKRFPSVSAPTGFEDANSHEHPFQAFQWADYTVEPGDRYRYRVIPMYGLPWRAARRAPPTNVTIGTEPPRGHQSTTSTGTAAPSPRRPSCDASRT